MACRCVQGRTALHVASSFAPPTDVDYVSTLLQGGADPNIEDKVGLPACSCCSWLGVEVPLSLTQPPSPRSISHIFDPCDTFDPC